MERKFELLDDLIFEMQMDLAEDDGINLIDFHQRYCMLEIHADRIKFALKMLYNSFEDDEQQS